MLTKDLKRPCLGWTGNDHVNGDEGDWLADLQYYITHYDKLDHQEAPKAMLAWLVKDLARHWIMAVDPDGSPEFTERAFQLLCVYQRAALAIHDCLQADLEKRQGYIMTKGLGEEYLTWFEVKLQVARGRRQKEGN